MTSKFTPLNLGPYFNADRDNQAIGPQGDLSWRKMLRDRLQKLPAGEQIFWGVPFHLAHAQAAKCWIRLGRGESRAEVTITPPQKASFILFAHFCNASSALGDDEEIASLSTVHILQPGQHLANYILIYEDGSEHRQAIRRRFEINEPTPVWGQLAFAAKPHTEDFPLDPLGAHVPGKWGEDQKGAAAGIWGSEQIYWIYALDNPHRDQPLKAIRVDATGEDMIAIAGITLYHAEDHPLRHRRLETLSLELDGFRGRPREWPIEIDLGILARVYASLPFSPDIWLSAKMKGFGEEATPEAPARRVLVDVIAAPDATLRVDSDEIEIKEVFSKGIAQSMNGKARVELLTPERSWLNVRLIDSETEALTPARVHFRAPDGRYLPPYGHRHQVNDNWFEDYGGDLKLGSTQYAYVPGQFQIELPVGECYLELSKGFEYRPFRRKIRIEPGQTELHLKVERQFNMRRKGWVTADTHVHFLSPQTAWLEAQAEGINLVNLLASQWGDLFTNVSDITGELSGVSKEDTLVWVGTENRQHMLGHISLLGGKGEPVYPLCASGPEESYLGDPTWTSMAEWADRCREREGVVVLPHFPNPYAEGVADIILGKIDGVEIREFYEQSLKANGGLKEWYRFLNLGYQVAAVGGTDKMSAGMPVGGVRTYAYLGEKEFTFDQWAAAVRAGHTFTTSGPIIGLEVEGKGPGENIRIPGGGGTLEARAWASSLFPFEVLQLVVNGEVVAEAESEGGYHASLDFMIRVKGSSWIAARCFGIQKAWHVWPVHITAHTSPVYILIGDQEQFNMEDAIYMMTLLEGGMTWVTTLSIQADAQRQAAILGTFENAHRQLDARLRAHAHGR